LTREAACVSGIPYVMDCDKEEVDQILGNTQNLHTNFEGTSISTVKS